ncbi:MAG TPA: L-seryl-tRNA(Sec) selenium transferase, partial [Clostridiaceae bacterium]|nr:L-seryl-tRNA(Sec) selenium transferase [Clostridiaceae bacterium]
MDDKNALLRGLPSVDELIRRRELLNYLERFGHNVVSTCIRRCLDATRTALLQGTLREVNIEAILGDVEVRIDEETRFGLRPVINATGVILHTNLGRAP